MYQRDEEEEEEAAEQRLLMFSNFNVRNRSESPRYVHVYRRGRRGGESPDIASKQRETGR